MLLALSMSLVSCTSILPDGNSIFPRGHISTNCRIYDMSAKLLRTIPGHLCLFHDDGTTTVLQGDSLTKFSKSYQPEWTQKLNSAHHQLKTGAITGNYLILESDFSTRGRMSFRSDVLKVVSPDGKIVKSVNFRHILRQLHQKNFRVKSFHYNKWMNNDSGKTVPYESSHVNSMYENFEIRDGKREFTGYIVNCYYQHKIIILDRDLATVVRVIDTGTRAVHDVQMLEPGKLTFYQNYFSHDLRPRYSSLVEYDLAAEKFTELYSARSYEFSSKACGSFQHLGETRFMLAHSSCLGINLPNFVPVLEFIDLRTLQREIVRFAPGYSMSSAETADLAGYLKNNAGM